MSNTAKPKTEDPVVEEEDKKDETQDQQQTEVEGE